MYKTINEVVLQRQMNDLAELLHVSQNRIFCGYIWQPIKILQDENGKYLIQGICSLQSGKHYIPCIQSVPSQEKFITSQCPYYLMQEAKWIQKK
jgi:hypothetical protein